MLAFIGRMLSLAAAFAGRIKLAFVLSFFENMLSYVPIFASLYVFTNIANNSLEANHAWAVGAMMLGAIVVRCILRRLFVGLQSGSGYEICAQARMAIGDRFKRFPMSYFTEGNLGNVTAAVSIDLLFIEEFGMSAMDKVVNGYMSIVIGCIVLFVIDWRVALVSAAVFICAMVVLDRLQSIAKTHSAIKQNQQARLTAAVIEYIRGISIIKSLNMTGRKAHAVKSAIEDARNYAIAYEEQFTPHTFCYQICFSAGIALIVLLATVFCLYKSMNIATMLMFLVSAFYIYIPTQALAGLTAQVRVMEAGLDRYEVIQQAPIIDENGSDSKLDRFDIEFKNVWFGYGQQEVLKNISFTIPAKSMTAVVGASGSGKTTLVNLMARFWDVVQGEVLVGGVNVRNMTCDSLLANVSMVFQKVYLFQDTILNNIKFGKMDATYEDVIAAAKKAQCHSFIMDLEHGYDTVIEAGGGSLSGGEKQRISIARAILKDAPIILLDEATASLDPDNEKYVQMAIDELVQDKTLVVIAHRLSTIRNADQILVIDNGEVVQQGTHDGLIGQSGQYSKLWRKRATARSWKITRAHDAAAG